MYPKNAKVVVHSKRPIISFLTGNTPDTPTSFSGESENKGSLSSIEISSDRKTAQKHRTELG